MRKDLLLGTIAVVIISCSSGKVPKDVIQPEQMKQIVYDLMRSEEAANHLKLDSAINTLTNRQLVMFNNVFAIHKISRENFYKSYRYYEEHPDLHKELMDSLSAYAGREKTKSYQHGPTPKPAAP